jgi:transcriptional regulator with XRE-family HTH domain
MKEFGQELRRLRHLHGFSQASLAKAAYYAKPAAISMIERGAGSAEHPGFAVILRLGKAMNLTKDELAGLTLAALNDYIKEANYGIH